MADKLELVFFQAEDGIRYLTVTGVQTCALPICLDPAYHEKQKTDRAWKIRYHYCHKNPKWNASILFGEPGWEPAVIQMQPSSWRSMHQIGRASCRERV